MQFGKLKTGDGFRFNKKLYIKLYLPVPCALDVKEGKGRVVKFKEDEEVEKVILDLSIIKM